MLMKTTFEATIREHISENYPEMVLAKGLIVTEIPTVLLEATLHGVTFTIDWNLWDIRFSMETPNGALEDEGDEEAWLYGFEEKVLIRWIDRWVDAYVIRGLTVEEHEAEVVEQVIAKIMKPGYRTQVRTVEELKATKGPMMRSYGTALDNVIPGDPESRAHALLKVYEIGRLVEMLGEAKEYFLDNIEEFF